MSRALVAASLVLLGVIPSARPAEAQQAAGGRRLATIESLRQFPGFFNLQNVLLRGEFIENAGRIMLKADERQIEVLLGETRTASGLVEVRAQLLDVGRLETTDPRLARYQGSREPDKWPKPGEELLLNVTAVTAVEPFVTPTVRALALDPAKFEGQSVTVVGQFRGRNLFGDLPGSPAKSKYDFVLRASEGAIWVSGLRPKGKGFDLNVDARADTSQWLKVTGVVKRERTMVTIDATAIVAAEPPTAQPQPDDEGPVVPVLPGEVVFSSPTDAEIDVPRAAPLRVQFSRGLNEATLNGNIRVTYAGEPAPLPAPEFQVTYDAPTRSIEIRFSKPVERFRMIMLKTLEGLRTFDGAPVTPWTLTFTVGE